MRFDWSSIVLLKKSQPFGADCACFNTLIFNIVNIMCNVHSIQIARAYFCMLHRMRREKEMRRETHRWIDDQQMFIIKSSERPFAEHLFTQTTVSRFSLNTPNDLSEMRCMERHSDRDTIHPKLCHPSKAIFVYNAKCGCSSIWVLIKE